MGKGKVLKMKACFWGPLKKEFVSPQVGMEALRQLGGCISAVPLQLRKLWSRQPHRMCRRAAISSGTQKVSRSSFTLLVLVDGCSGIHHA